MRYAYGFKSILKYFNCVIDVFLIRNISERNMRLKIGKNLVTFQRKSQAEFQTIARKSCFYKPIFGQTRNGIETASAKALCTRDRIRTAPFFSGSDPEFFQRAHGIGAKIICVHTGADPSGSNSG